MQNIKKVKDVFLLFLLVVLAIPSIYPLFHQGFFQTDDGEWMVIRFAAFHQALRDGQFPVRFLGTLNHGYGYPVANFIYPGFMYLGEFIRVLGIGFVSIIKIILAFSLIGSLVFSFLWLTKLFKRFEAFIGSLVYLYAPYHLYDIYKRGSVGEVLALGIIPFVFWQIERSSFFWISTSIALLILSHNTLALLFLPLIFAYSLIQKKRIIKELICGLCLSAFFWIPAVFDIQYTVFNNIQVSEWRNYFADFGLVGGTFIISLLVSLVFLFLKKNVAVKKTLFIFFFIIGIGSVILATSISYVVWKILPVSFIQFPFRFLSIWVLCSCFLSAFILYCLPKKNKVILGIFLLSSLIFSSYSFLFPAQFFDKEEGFYSTNQDTTTVKNEYMPKWVKTVPTKRWEKKIEFQEGQILEESIKSNSMRFSVTALKPGILRINTVYFPGWTVRIDGKTAQLDYENNNGLITVFIPSGKHYLEVFFTETPVRLTSDIISILGFLAIMYLTWFKKSHNLDTIT